MPPSDAPVVGIAEVQEALQALAQHQRLEPLQNILRTHSDVLQSYSEQLLTSVLALCTTKPPADTGFARLNVTWKVLLTLLTSPTLSEARYGEGLRYMFAQLRWAIVGHDWHEARLVKLGAFIASHVSSAIRGQAVRFTQFAATAASSNNTKDKATLGVQLMELYTLANVTVALTLRAHDAAKALYEAVVQRLDVVLHALGVACATGISDSTLKTNDRYRSYRLLIDVCVAQNVTMYTRREERVTCVLATLAAHLSLVQGFTQTLTKQLTEEEGGDSELRAVTAWTLRALLYWLPGMSLCAEADTPTGKGVHSETLRRIQGMAHDLPASLWLNSITTHSADDNSSSTSEAPCERWQRCVSELLSIYCSLPLLPDTHNMGSEDDGVMTCLVTALSSPHGRVGLRVLHACLSAAHRTHELRTNTRTTRDASSNTVTRRPCIGLYCMQQVLQLGQAMWKADMNTTTIMPVEQQQKAQPATRTNNTKENGALNDERTCLSRWWTAWRAMSAAGLALLLGVVCVSMTGHVPSMTLKEIQAHMSTPTSLAYRDTNQLPADNKDTVGNDASASKSPAGEDEVEEDGFVCLADFAAVLYLQTLPVEATEQASAPNTTLANEQEEKVSEGNAELLRSLQTLMEGMWSTCKPCTTTTNGISHEEPTPPLQTFSQEQTSSLHKTLGLMRNCVQILYQLQQLRRQCTTSMHSEAYTNAIHSLARPFAALTRALQAIASSSSSVDRTHTPATVSNNIVCERVVVRLFAAALLREAAHFTIRVESVAADAALLACVRRWVDVAFDICPASLAHVAVRRPRCDLAILSTGAAAHNEQNADANKKNENEEEEEEEENVNQARLQEALNEVVSYYATASLLYLVEHNTALPMDKLSLSELSVRLLMRLLQHMNPDTQEGEEGEEEKSTDIVKKKKEKAAAELRREDAKRFAHTAQLWQACLTQYYNNSKSAAANHTFGSNTHTYTMAKDESMSVAALVQQWQQCAQSLRSVTACLCDTSKKRTDEEKSKSGKQVRHETTVTTPSHTVHYSAEDVTVMREALKLLLTCAQQTQKSLTETSCNGNTGSSSSCPAEPVIEVD